MIRLNKDQGSYKVTLTSTQSFEKDELVQISSRGFGGSISVSITQPETVIYLHMGKGAEILISGFTNRSIKAEFEKMNPMKLASSDDLSWILKPRGKFSVIPLSNNRITFSLDSDQSIGIHKDDDYGLIVCSSASIVIATQYATYNISGLCVIPRVSGESLIKTRGYSDSLDVSLLSRNDKI